ncbi:hypothetical protein EEB14_57240 [Rhodococcus sp. WS4]|nr:hypothetical protein EEB14_57240 [Rhodococcus sp. WS4]
MAKFEVEHELDPDSIRRAWLAVAARAHDAEDCRILLSSLGILPEPDTPADSQHLVPPVRCRVRR